MYLWRKLDQTFYPLDPLHACKNAFEQFYRELYLFILLFLYHVWVVSFKVALYEVSKNLWHKYKLFLFLPTRRQELFCRHNPCIRSTIVQSHPDRHVFRLGLQNEIYYVPHWLNDGYRRVKGTRDRSLPEALRPKTGCSPKQEKPSSAARVVENNMFLFGSNKTEKTHTEI